MCGTAGVIYSDPARPVDRSVLKAMGDGIAHRGPDAEGFWCEPGLGLVHRRLSIIDLSGGDQPIGNEDGSVQVVLNGEIYNFQELRESLEAKGHQFRTRTDTEVIVHLYEEEGEKVVERLRGRKLEERRSDDRPETVRERLHVYRQNAEPLVGFYRKRRLLADVDGVGEVAEIAARIGQALAGVTAPSARGVVA